MKSPSEFKQRVIHAVCYEAILLVIGTPILSVILGHSLSQTGVLWIMMSVTALVWNMLFNHGFEKFEKLRGWTQRTVRIRILHAIGFEGGLLIATVPMIAWMLDMNLWDALLLDIGLALSIMVYTFIYQWCYDILKAKYFNQQQPE